MSDTTAPDIPTAQAVEMAKAFADYEYRHVDLAVRVGDLPDEAINDCETAAWLLDSLRQHPDDQLPHTVEATSYPPAAIRAALERVWTDPTTVQAAYERVHMAAAVLFGAHSQAAMDTDEDEQLRMRVLATALELCPDLETKVEELRARGAAVRAAERPPCSCPPNESEPWEPDWDGTLTTDPRCPWHGDDEHRFGNSTARGEGNSTPDAGDL